MIIVTGGTGFIGSNLVAGLEERGIKDIVICDWLGTENKWRNVAKRELHDIVFPEDLFFYLEEHADEIEAIFHMGAISSTTETDVDLIVESNFTLSRSLWQWCALNNARFIYASSAATYGGGEEGFSDKQDIDSLAKLRPLNAYGWSKHVFDRCIARTLHDKETANKTVPIQWAGLKFFNVYGPNEYHKGEQMSVICKLYPQIKAGANAKLFKSYHTDYKDGGQLRDFVYVKDCVDVMIWLYENQSVNGLFNIGTGKARSFVDLAKATFLAANMEEKITYIDMPETLKPKYQYFTQADMNKLRSVGYDKAFTSLEDGIKEYIQEYMSKEDDKYI